MLGRTHMALGMVTSLLVSTFLGNSYFHGEIDSTTIVIIIIAALLPDLDMGTSSLAKRFGILKVNHIRKIWLGILIILATVTVIYLKNTRVFYGILFILLLGALFSKDFAQKGYYMLRNFVQGMVGIGFIVAACYYRQWPLAGVGVILISLLLSKHRGLSHSLLFLVITFIIVRSISDFYGYRDYSVFFGISMLSHILGDMFTKMGVELFYPFSKKRIKFPYTIKTGGKLENIIFFAACLMAFRLSQGL